jgi:hypothetical protein
MSVNQIYVNQMYVDQMSVNQISVNQMSVNEMPVNQMYTVSTTIYSFIYDYKGQFESYSL